MGFELAIGKQVMRAAGAALGCVGAERRGTGTGPESAVKASYRGRKKPALIGASSVQQGLDELDRGEGVPIEEVKAKIAQWAGK